MDGHLIKHYAHTRDVVLSPCRRKPILRARRLWIQICPIFVQIFRHKPTIVSTANSPYSGRYEEAASMTVAAIIVAAGRGTRVGGNLPKQWRTLAGRPVAHHTLATFLDHPVVSRIVFVHHPEDTHWIEQLPANKVEFVEGGVTRDASVRAGLEALEGEEIDRVLIHDVARPLVSRHIIDAVLEEVAEGVGAAPALPVSDALWRGDSGRVGATVDRAELFRAQTPQGFLFKEILGAHRTIRGPAADDVEVARDAGVVVRIVPGDERNLKITTEEDFVRAERFLESSMEVRTGSGYDVHRFGEGASVWLCGIEIAHGRSLKGHSDADVGMHAITDALYGALAEGDIGRHFPPSDPQWKGAESHIFLTHAAQLVTQKGFRISNVDCTLICERPKIGPHAAAMQEALARIMGIEADRVSVKATTSERLGFTGREEGIAAMAVATVVKP